MRFLCFHGEGTNSKFVEGCMPMPMWPDIREAADADDGFFGYFTSGASYTTAARQLDAYLAAEGPFDGVLAFSMGAAFVSTYIANAYMYHDRAGHEYAGEHQQRPEAARAFKCAVFLSPVGGVFAEAAPGGQGDEGWLLDADVDGEVIPIPTANIWGSNDRLCNAEAVSRLCASGVREVYVHEGVHEVPGARMPDAVKASVRVIRRVVATASRQ
ncbi:DUF341 domain protein [Podospora appendiculata]|uniref:DUF341 domain protein n=1 Tax=Podospora appendiculata TaxID=314037 RepID=A0AAE1CD06_9PEZI|nr:DUF341 domain protein [Podospora appendiculata]